jgi:hypothetical protein
LNKLAEAKLELTRIWTGNFPTRGNMKHLHALLPATRKEIAEKAFIKAANYTPLFQMPVKRFFCRRLVLFDRTPFGAFLAIVSCHSQICLHGSLHLKHYHQPHF